VIVVVICAAVSCGGERGDDVGEDWQVEFGGCVAVFGVSDDEEAVFLREEVAEEVGCKCSGVVGGGSI